MCYVDDPLAVVMGDTTTRKTTMAMMVLVWESMGFRLSYKKGQRGRTVDWIGGTLTLNDDGITAKVKQSIIDDIQVALKSFEGKNVLSRKDVRSFVGRCNHAAGLLVTLRPFLQALWASLSSDNTGPNNTVWEKQVHHSLSWMRVFFANQLTGLERTFSLQEYLQTGDIHEIGTDASPYGLGGWLAINGNIVQHFACAVTSDDKQILSLVGDSCRDQQILESLAILVALRLWSNESVNRCIRLTIRGDNVGALTLVMRMRPANAQQAIISREIALETANCAFPPLVVHTPGVAHKIADELSRVNDPNKDVSAVFAHPALVRSSQRVCPPRPAQWYKTLVKADPLRSG